MICATQINAGLFSYDHLVHMFEVIQKTKQKWVIFWNDSDSICPTISDHVQIFPYPELPDYLQTTRDLPLHRNSTKDTEQFIQSGYAKYACIRRLIGMYDPDTIICWFEPDNVFFVPNTTIRLENELNMVYSQMQTGEVDSDRVYIPGEWNPVQSKGDIDYLSKSPHWRFNGKCIFGKRTGFEAFVEIGEKGAREYYKKHPNILVWEFNVLAWTEYKWITANAESDKETKDSDDETKDSDDETKDSDDETKEESGSEKEKKWPVIWYVAPPNGDMFQIPVYLNISTMDNAIITALDCPSFPYLYASSASRVETPRETVINIRYINYRIESVGRYTFPPQVTRIHTKNYAIVQLPDGTEYRGWAEEKVGLPPLTDRVPFTTGLEDVRLYYDAYSDTIRFSATTLEYSSTPKIITGQYELRYDCNPESPCVMTHGRVLASPGGNATKQRWEKNWIPVDHPCSNIPSFIYKWGPLQIGLPDENGELRIHTEYESGLARMNRACGSSPFVRDRVNNQYVGVVHYYDNSVGRKYCHFLLWLDMDTLSPCAISAPFTFMGKAVEYCLSVHMSSASTFTFIASVFDRDPVIITVPSDIFGKGRVSL